MFHEISLSRVSVPLPGSQDSIHPRTVGPPVFFTSQRSNDLNLNK